MPPIRPPSKPRLDIPDIPKPQPGTDVLKPIGAQKHPRRPTIHDAARLAAGDATIPTVRTERGYAEAPKRPRHPHPVTTRIQLLIEGINAIRHELENIPTTYSSANTLQGTKRASKRTIARNQTDEVMERIIPHLQRARTYAQDL